MYKGYLFVAGSLLLFMLGGCADNNRKQSKSITELQEEKGYPVRIQRAAVEELVKIDRQGGVVKGVYQTTIRVGVPGTISSIPISTGSTVRRNGIIAKVEPDGASPYVLAKTEFENAKKSYERIEALQKEGGVSQDVLDQVKARYDVAAENLSAARKTVNVVAPFSGVVLEIMEELNSKVGAGTAVAKIAKVDELMVELSVNEAGIRDYAEGQNAFIVVPGDTVWGEVERVGAGANEQTHSFPVTVSINNHNQLLKPGMFVTVSVVTARKNAVMLPIDIIRLNGDEAFVYKISESTAHRTPVRLGVRGNSGFEIIDGISEGDLVVMQGASLLHEGAKIRIVN